MMIPRTATLRGPRAAIPVGWMVLGLSAASWGLLILAVQIVALAFRAVMS